LVTELVDEVIALNKRAQDADADAWLRRQLAELGK